MNALVKLFDISKATLPPGFQWSEIVNQYTFPTQFVGICEECKLRIMWCLDGSARTYFPNNAACSRSYDVDEIFPKSSKADDGTKYVLMPFQADETVPHLDSEKAKELQEKSVEVRRENKSRWFNREKS